ncbi:MAG: hypothetical protein V1847_03280 [Candidatus Diapherotrites archaeon]
MKKALLILAFLLAFSASALAEIQLIYPVEQTVESGQVIDLNVMQPGETLKLIFNANIVTQKADRWSSIEISNLPEQWRGEIVSQQNPNTLVVDIFVPSNAQPSTYSFNVILKDEAQNVSETVEVIVGIRSNLLSFSIDNAQPKTIAGETVIVKLTANNDSVAAHPIRIDSTLPAPWMRGMEISLEPKSFQTIELNIVPQASGKKNFQISILDGNSRQILKSFDMQLEATPTLKSKYEASLYGFPFFSPGLLPYYLINAFFGQFLH